MSVTTKLYHLLTPFLLALSFCLSTAYAESHAPRTVKALGTLTAIVNKNYIDAEVTNNQIMVAILAANPEAFRGGNINFMIRNADLKLPSVESIKSIPNRDATNLLNEHYRLFKRGRTGNLPPPTFISANSEQVETLVKEKAEQSEKLNTLEQEREQLREQVKRLEDEKSKRDNDLRALEERIESLQSSSNSVGSARAELKLKLANGELTGEGAKLLEELDARNRSLNAQLQSARSEMAESTRMEITLERRMSDIQEENGVLAQALKEKGVSPAEVVKQLEDKSGTEDATSDPAGVASTLPETTVDTSTTAAAASQTAENSQVAATEASQTTPQGSLFEQYFDFIPKDLRWLIWLLPIFLILALLWFIWKLLRGGNNSNPARRVQQPATTPAFVDYTQPIDPELEIEQEPQLEVSIKMDVARAYIEAGDYTAAREMLAEVISEGNTSQQQEANQLFAQISTA